MIVMQIDGLENITRVEKEFADSPYLMAKEIIRLRRMIKIQDEMGISETGIMEDAR